jgi:hypothetical protein
MRNIALSLVIVSLLGLAGCKIGGIATPSTATPEEVGKRVITHLAAGETESLAALFISTDEFKATFGNLELEHFAHSELKRDFMARVKERIPQFHSAQFVRMNMKHCPQPIRAKAGTDFGGGAFKVDTFVLDNVRVIAKVDGRERELRLDAMVKTDDGWKIISPDLDLLPTH